MTTPIPEYITASDIQNRMTADAYTRWFSRATQGTVDAAFVALCITDACSQWNVWMGDALPGDWTANGGTVQNVVKRHLVNLSLFFAAEANPRPVVPGQESGNPWQSQYNAAAAFADELRKGHKAKLLTEAITTPLPKATVATVDNTDDSAASPYVRVANGSVVSGF